MKGAASWVLQSSTAKSRLIAPWKPVTWKDSASFVKPRIQHHLLLRHWNRQANREPGKTYLSYYCAGFVNFKWRNAALTSKRAFMHWSSHFEARNWWANFSKLMRSSPESKNRAAHSKRNVNLRKLQRGSSSHSFLSFIRANESYLCYRAALLHTSARATAQHTAPPQASQAFEWSSHRMASPWSSA